jgi:hypothetical protein
MKTRSTAARFNSVPVRVALAGVIAAMAAFATIPSADAAARNNWVPNNGAIDTAEGEAPLGDVWLFTCPKNADLTISLDTADDNGEGPAGDNAADLEPDLTVYNKSGTVVSTAPTLAGCTYDPVCGAQCPTVTISCPKKAATYTIIVKDKEGASACVGGGGYVLRVDGASEKALKLGGGPKLKLPTWETDDGEKLRGGPAIDDGQVLSTAP